MRSLRRALGLSFLLLLGLAAIEATCQVTHRVTRGSWLAAGYPGESIHGAFQRHAHLVGAPRPNFQRTESGVSIAHNSRGFRGPEVVRPKPRDVTRIVALGGSTTYCTGVSEPDTWPVRLQRELGPGFEVVNLGVPGYSSVENVVQTAFLLSDLSPDIAIYYEGWNDLRNSHVRDLAPDYANFHARHLYRNLGLFQLRVGNRSALLFYLRRLVEAVFIQDPLTGVPYSSTANRLTDRPDPRVLSLYGRNLASIIALARAQGIRPILVPQVLNDAAMLNDSPGRWVPLIRVRDVPKVMATFNFALARVARLAGAEAVMSVLDATFEPEDFLDHGHFSPSGNEKFAQILASHLRATARAGRAAGSRE